MPNDRLTKTESYTLVKTHLELKQPINAANQWELNNSKHLELKQTMSWVVNPGGLTN